MLWFRINRREQKLFGISPVHHGPQTRRGNIQIYAAGTSGNAARYARATAKGISSGLFTRYAALTSPFGHTKLVKALISALIQINRSPFT